MDKKLLNNKIYSSMKKYYYVPMVDIVETVPEQFICASGGKGQPGANDQDDPNMGGSSNYLYDESNPFSSGEEVKNYSIWDD